MQFDLSLNTDGATIHAYPLNQNMPEENDDVVITVTGANPESGNTTAVSICIAQNEIGPLIAGLKSVAMFAAALRFAPEAPNERS